MKKTNLIIIAIVILLIGYFIFRVFNQKTKIENIVPVENIQNADLSEPCFDINGNECKG